MPAITDELLSQIDDTISGFDKDIPGIQKQIFAKIVNLLKGLETDGDHLKNSVANLKAISRMKTEIEKIVFNPNYERNVTEFLKAYDLIAELNNDYFKALTEDFKPDELLKAVKDSAIDMTADRLTESGINAAVIDPVRDMLNTAVTSGGTYSDLIDTLRTNLLTDDQSLGTLQKYTRQITTDSINQFSAQYNKTIASGLGFKSYMYIGSNLNTTRPFCKHLTEKKYIYEAELPDILDGDIDGHIIPINPKTGIWAGGIPGTNEANFPINRGGYNCGHQLYAVSEKMVPKAVRIETYLKYGIEMDEEGFAV